MKQLSIALILCVALFQFGCESGSTNDGQPSGDGTSQPTNNQDEVPGDSFVEVKKPDCPIEGSVLESNEFWAKDENLVVAVAATSETNDPDFGESHRVFEVYDGEKCERILQKILPVNHSPDFPYYLSDITYNKVNHLLAVRGFNHFYIFDLEKKELSNPVHPKFLNERYMEDAQSGMITRLEVWEKYLIGHAQNMGVFVFDLKNPMSAAPILPAAEFEASEGSGYNSLFFLESSAENGGHQIIIPHFDYENEKLEIRPVMDKPRKVETKIARNVRDNRFLVIRELLGGNESRPIGIDMEKMKRVELPDDISKQKTKDIVAWMKQQ